MLVVVADSAAVTCWNKLYHGQVLEDCVIVQPGPSQRQNPTIPSQHKPLAAFGFAGPEGESGSFFLVSHQIKQIAFQI